MSTCPTSDPARSTATRWTAPTTRAGQRFNPNKLLIDPYAKAVSGPIDWSDDLFGYTVGDQAEDLSFDPP